MNCLVCSKGFEVDHFLSHDCQITGVTCDQIGVCPQCLADAKLGRLVRSMTRPGEDLCLKNDMRGKWVVLSLYTWESDLVAEGDTALEALERAMGEER